MVNQKDYYESLASVATLCVMLFISLKLLLERMANMNHNLGAQYHTDG